MIIVGAVVGVIVLLTSFSVEGGSVSVRSAKGRGIVQPAAPSTPAGVGARGRSGARGAADEADRPQTELDPKSRLPLVRSLEGMRQYGDPPGADYARLKIPSQGVNAAVAALKVDSDGNMGSPAGPADVVWYNLSVWGLGGTPGDGGNAVFSAHVDYDDVVPFANVSYQGVGVFFNLSRLQQGDIIEVEYRGQALRYAVEWRRQLSEDSDWTSVLSATGDRDSITLITCSGDFDISRRTYDSRTVVRAVRL